MHNPAPTHHQVHELIQHRWSPRAFSEQPVPADVLRSLFEAARWAPSSSNEQPWAFLVTTTGDKENHAKMLSTLVEFNQGWAKHAPVLAIAVSEMASPRPENPIGTPFTIPARPSQIFPPKLPLGGSSCIKWQGSILIRPLDSSKFQAGGNRLRLSRSATRAIRKPCPRLCASVNWRRGSGNRSNPSSWAGIGARRRPSSGSNPHELCFYRGTNPACTARSNSWSTTVTWCF